MSAPKLADLLARARESGDLSELVQAIPFDQLIGLQVLREEGKVIGKLPAAPHLVGNPALPALHGGVLGALLESIAIFHVLAEAPIAHAPKTISLTIEYLRSAKLADTFARAEMVRQGRRVATVRSFAWQDDAAQPVAAANVQLLLPPVVKP